MFRTNEDKGFVMKIKELRHELHRHPELSGQEKWTKQYLIDFIRTNTSLDIVDEGNWFYAAYRCGKPGQPGIVFRADFDAVAVEDLCEKEYRSQNPGIGHKCGHDGHSAVLCGLALEVEKRGADRDVFFLFQHAEENGRGAKECVSILNKENISHIFAFHNWSGLPEGCIAVREGVSQCASKGLTIRFTGKVSHASMPEDGVNPAVAVARMILYMNEKLKKGMDEDELLFGTVVHSEIGSRNFGISAGKGEVSITLRANEKEKMDRYEQELRRYAEKLAKQEDLSVDFEVSDDFPDTTNSPEGVEIIRCAAKSMGLELTELSRPYRASEDFGWYLKKCKGAIFYIGNGEDYPALHNPEYDFNDAILSVAVDMELAICFSENCCS